MKPLPLKDGEGPYKIPSSVANRETGRAEERITRFFVRPFGEVENKPLAFIISESPDNKGQDISMVVDRIADRLHSIFAKLWPINPRVDYPDVGKLHFFVHYPENVRGNGPERYYRADIHYEGKSPRVSHTSQFVSPADVAKIVGAENVSPGYKALPPQSVNKLSMQAFESGMADRSRWGVVDNNSAPDPGRELG